MTAALLLRGSVPWLALLLTTDLGAQVINDSLRGAEVRGYAVGIVDSTDGSLTTAPTLPHALQARLPGVSVSQGEGMLGSPARVWLRGPTSFFVNAPLVIIDGARTHGAVGYRALGGGGRPMPSRLEDIDMMSVERITVLRGPAASAIYGPGSSKGVILVTTRQGRPGPARWTAFGESGPLIETTEFPANYGFCPLADGIEGRCTPGPLRVSNPLEDESPFRTGWANRAGLAVSGGSNLLSYHVAGSHHRVDGVYDLDRSRATNARINLSATPVSTVDIRLTSAWRSDRRRHPSESWVLRGLYGYPPDEPGGTGYRPVPEPYLPNQPRQENIERGTLSLTASWTPWSWLRTSALLGYDRLGVAEHLGYRNAQYPGAPDTVTIVQEATDRAEARSADARVTMVYSLGGVQAQTSLGAAYIRENDRRRAYDAIVPESGPASFSRSGVNGRRTSLGSFVQQHFAFGDRLFLAGSLRSDRPGGASDGLDAILGHSLDVSWLAKEEPDPASEEWLREVRLRAAYGRGGAHAIRTIDRFDQGRPIFATQAAERGTEIEVGADATLFGHSSASLTHYRSTVDRGIEPTWVDPGFQVLMSGVEMRASGFEAAANTLLLARPGFAWTAGVSVTAQHSEIISGSQYVANRTPLGEYGGTPYTYVDANDDGILVDSEVTLSSGGPVAMGSPFPGHEVAIRTEMSLRDRVRLSAVVDQRGDARLYNRVDHLRCGAPRCRASHDPASTLAEQARIIAGRNNNRAPYIEDAAYTKLREVQLTIHLPDRLARHAGASAARLTMTGRNLFTRTRYSGLDPEPALSRHDGVGVPDFAYQPPLRSFSARIDFVW